MDFIIFDFVKHISLIDGFLESAAQAHNQPKRSKEWFLWKFRDNPYGESLLLCAEDSGKIVGCVGYSIHPFLFKNKFANGAYAVENFVHPEYQGKGLFKKLITLTEQLTSEKDIDFLLVFPNSNSLPGYQRMNWTKLPSPEYWIKGRNNTIIPKSLIKLRSSFRPNESNITELLKPSNFKQRPQDQLTLKISTDYLDWRFFTHPVSEYIIVENPNYYSILRMGTRGGIREAQVLFVNYQDTESFSFKKFIEHCQSKTKYDIISFPISKYNPIRRLLKNSWFIKVPNNTNMCYKILNPKVVTDQDLETISLSAINYHTY